jgi:predicted ATPase
VYLSSVGVGVSQVLPVILLCLLSEPADLLILEQPELHLHPPLQKRLADFLLVFVRAGRQILVETHSDHLVNRLRYQVASDDTDEIRNLVKLIFAEQKDGITTYRESEINEYGGLSEDWPDGFLDIGARSAQDLVRQSLRKMKVRGPESAEAN